MNEGQRFVLFGHPVSHSLSPVIHAAAYAALGLPHAYEALDLPTDVDFFQAVTKLRDGLFGGANVTIPYKRLALELADVVESTAELPGVANVLCRDESGRIHAYNTDADALADDIASVLPDAEREGAVVMGGGGAGFAAVVACRKLGYRRIGVTSRSWSTQEYLDTLPVAARMRALGADVFPWPTNDSSPRSLEVQRLSREWLEFVRASSLILQATSAGMVGADAGEPIAAIVPWGDLGERTLAYDVVYNPRVTPFLRAAMTHQRLARGGLGMLIRQAARAIELWTGQSPPLDVMFRAAEQTLDRRGQTG
ncbi:MAG TPA: shikimate dehydrogenase [Polyangium sp.]|nr:shikimate dehydrogenase [Polyangium sp.]